MSKHALAKLGVALVALYGTSAGALDLEYNGYISGTKAGTARVRIEAEDGRYFLNGRLRTEGLWDLLARWNARFAVTGRVEEGRAVPEELRMREKNKRKDRTIRVSGGILRQVKNGEQRAERYAPIGIDVMSALWVTTACDEQLVVNNGRHYYSMTLANRVEYDDGSERCDYDIVDDDGETSTGWVRLGTWHGRRIPETIVVVDGIERQLNLVEAKPIDDTRTAKLVADLEFESTEPPASEESAAD